jgi:hypothetical protein
VPRFTIAWNFSRERHLSRIGAQRRCRERRQQRRVDDRLRRDRDCISDTKVDLYTNSSLAQESAEARTLAGVLVVAADVLDREIREVEAQPVFGARNAADLVHERSDRLLVDWPGGEHVDVPRRPIRILEPD